MTSEETLGILLPKRIYLGIGERSLGAASTTSSFIVTIGFNFGLGVGAGGYRIVGGCVHEYVQMEWEQTVGCPLFSNSNCTEETVRGSVTGLRYYLD